MQPKKKLLTIFVLILVCLAIHFYSADAARVEVYYSTGIYPVISRFLRILTGWLPFSFGDILYGIVTVWSLWKLLKTIIRLFKREVDLSWIKRTAYKIVICSLSIYIVFNLLWGINYDRKGIAWQIGLDKNKYTLDELRTVDSLLLKKVNEKKFALLQSHSTIKNTKEIFNASKDAYKSVANKFPFLTYKNDAVKTSMWGWLGNYFGFIGYYDPFTGEAQVNTTVPYFLQPYTTCHEMAHQLGYAKEDEANFVGYLAAAASSDTLFHYSVYLDLFLSTNRNLFAVDSVSAKTFFKQLRPEVRSDLKQWRTFVAQHKNPVEPVIRWMYGKYLENNKQPSGNLTYDEVTGWLIAYYKKYGEI